MPSCFMVPGQKLLRGERVTALNGDYNLVHQYDGNVVLYVTAGGKTPWSTNTWGKTTTHLTLEEDGDFVLYNGSCLVWKLDYSTLKNQAATGKCTSVLMEDNGGITFKTESNGLLGLLGDPQDVATGTFDHSKIFIGGVLPLGGSLFTHGHGAALNFTTDGGIKFTNTDGVVKNLRGVSGGEFLSMQDDGNLVFYGPNSKDVVYSFNSYGYTARGAKGAMILPSGDLVLIDDVNATPENPGSHILKTLFDFSRAC